MRTCTRIFTAAAVLFVASSTQAGNLADPAAPTAAPQSPPKAAHIWAAWGGEVSFRFNPELLRAIRLEVANPQGATSRGEYMAFVAEETAGLEFDAPLGAFRTFTGGSLRIVGGFDMQFPGGVVTLRDFRLRPSGKNPMVLELVDAGGKAWFYIDHLMYELTEADTVLAIPTMDLRIAPALAKRMGNPRAADLPIADMRLTAQVRTEVKIGEVSDSCSSPNWPGTPGFLADVLLTDMSVVFKRCRQAASPGSSCDGPGGDDGEVVFAPSSTLRNSGSWNGVPNVSEIPWYTKFSGVFPPNGNDQHPFLIWNLYRVNQAGQLDQIGRSGVKHAFLTINSGCEEACGNAHILGKGCGDTYSSGNNDSNSDLGPRREIVPAKGQWGRCGSIYDTNCDGVANGSGNTSWDQRLISRESQLDAAQNPGARYYFESWYVIRDDSNIYNSMGFRQITPTFGGGVWAGSSPQAFSLGPVLSAWVDPVSPGPSARNTELVAPEGRARVAVKAVSLGGGQYRYDYAVMNFDFARAVTDGAEPNLRVERNLGFNSFSVELLGPVSVSGIGFGDGDASSANDWMGAATGSSVTWTAPAGNELNWGTLFRFSFLADAPPSPGGQALLGVAEAGTPASYSIGSLRPDNDTIFIDGFD
ncbi:MAG TPA: hypothetical protein VJU18_08595 [Vicinamibacteria bacterium]|nr:hypothetical protein [Vicinamibacteria bacterium]